MVDLKLLPGTARNDWGYNGVPFAQDNVVTVSDGGNVVQYAVWWNTARQPIIGKRTYPGGDWETFDLGTVTGNPLAWPVALDGHNTINLGVDSTGRLHVAGNMHVNPMRYVRSVAPHDITSWVTTNKPGQGFTALTYPQFFRRSNGDLYIAYREGVSGNGDDWIEKWNQGTGTWGTATKVIDGKTTSENPYLHRIAVGPDESIHFAIIWRGTGNANTNADLCHIKSLDGGVTWKNQAGTTLALPVTRSTAPLVLDTAATGSGLLNTSGIDVDGNGIPHIATHIYDESGVASRVLYSHWDASAGAWVNDRLMDWSYKMPLNVSVINAEIARPVIFVTGTNRVFVIYRNNRDNLRGAVRIREVTPGGGTGDAPIVNLELYAYEPCYDTAAVRDRGQLHMLITPCRTADPAIPEYGAEDWTQQPAGVLTVDLATIDTVLAGTAVIPDAWEDTTTAPPPTAPAPVGIAAPKSTLRWISCDLVTGTLLEDLPDISGDDITRVIGAYTSAALTMPIPLAGPGALSIGAVEAATEPKRTMLVPIINDLPSWAGIVLVRKGGTGATLELGTVSLEGYLDRRYVADHKWAQQDMASVIAAGLVADANIDGINFVIDAPPMGTLADREYKDSDDAKVYARLQELMATEGGPEWTVDLDWTDSTQTALTKIVRIRDRIGVASATPEATFSTLEESSATYDYTEDYSDGAGANHVTAYSSGEGEDRPASTPAVDVRPGVPRYEHRITPSSSITSKPVLDAHARAELARLVAGTRTWRIAARLGQDPSLNLHWKLGDDVAWNLVGHRHPAGAVGQGRAVGWRMRLKDGTVEPILPDAEGA